VNISGLWEQLREQPWAARGAVLVAILIVGWLGALALASTVRTLLRKLRVDARLAGWLDSAEHDKSAQPLTVEAWIAGAVYWLALASVLVAFLQGLGLESVSLPINAFLTRITAFAPQLFGAAVLLAGAWILARVCRALVTRSMRTLKLDQRTWGDGTEAQRESLSRALGETAYWLVFLFFLPGVLGALNLTGLLTPVQHMLDQVLGTLPRLASGGLVLVAGWFMARVVQRIVTNVLRAGGADQLSTRVGLDRVLGSRHLSDLAGVIVHALVLLPVAVAALNAVGFESITAPASNMLNTMLAAVPRLFGAALLLGISYIAARLLGGLAQNLLSGMGFDHVLVKLGLATARSTETDKGASDSSEATKAEDALRPSAIADRVVVVAVMLFAAMEAARMLGFVGIAELVMQFTVFGGHLLAGLVLVGAGLYLGNFAARSIEQSRTEQSKLLALLARVSILALAGAMALEEVGLASQIIVIAFGLVLGAVCAAFALAFGLGSREIAAREVDRWFTQLRDKSQTPVDTAVYAQPLRSNPPPAMHSSPAVALRSSPPPAMRSNPPPNAH